MPGSTQPYPANLVHSQPLKVYVCPTDYTYGQAPNDPANWAPSSETSYAVNFQAFGKAGSGGTTHADWDGKNRIPASFSDGTSNTVMVAEKLATCGGVDQSNLWGNGSTSLNNSVFAVGGTTPFPATYPPFDALFAKPMNATLASCPTGVATTAHDSGLVVGLVDGSTRLLAFSTSQATWTAVLTPSAGDLTASDWD